MRSFFSWLAGACCVTLLLGISAPPAFAQAPSFGEAVTNSLIPGLGAYRAARTLIREDERNGSAVNTIMDYVYPQRTSVEVDSQGNVVSERTETPQETARRQLGVPTTGTIVDTLTAKLVGFIAFMMGVIVSFLGKVILLLINVLLGFLTYNGFADAPPVVIGWRMVRDLANMFFIVILILASYGTILGWRTNELHVKNILPKVLMAAVLVNFSKTIVALLIDASQVVMLTFVNAFASIGAGNFTNALHLPLITSSNAAGQFQRLVANAGTVAATGTQNVVAAGAGQVILDVIISSALQIFLLVVAIGVMLMMVVFVVGRIVGLWMLLIFSPIPFLASALPGSMKNVLGSQVGKYWSQLSGLLTGGPVMAFWLWLTFATLSAQGQDERLGLYTQTGGQVGAGFDTGQNAISMFMSAIGNAQGLGSYLIAIAMMMMGLQAAIDAAGALKDGGVGSGLMQDIAKKTKNYAQKAALYGAGGGVLAGGYMAARGAGWVAGGAAGAVDRRYDIRGNVAGAVRRLPFAGQNKWLREQQFKNRNEAYKEAKETRELLKNSNATKAEEDTERSIARLKYGLAGSNAMNLLEREELAEKAANLKSYDKDLKPQKEKNTEELKKSLKDETLAKRFADRANKQEATRRAIADLERQKSLITTDTKRDEKDKEDIDEKIKALRKASPHLLTDEEQRQKQLKEARQNWSSLDADAKTNFDFLRSVANEGAFVEDKATGRLKVGDENAIQQTRNRLTGRDRQNFEAMVQHIRESGEVDAAGNFKATGIKIDRLKNMSIEQDSNFKNRVVEIAVNEKGEIDAANTGYRHSDRRNFAITKIQSELSAGSAVDWLDRSAPDGRPAIHGVGTSAGVENRFVQHAKTVGIAEAVQNVGGAMGADGKWEVDAKTAAPMRAAAVHAAANYVQGKLSERTASAEAKVEYTDTSGNKVEKTRAEAAKDSKAPQYIKDQIKGQYQAEIQEVLPMLEGMNDLPQDLKMDVVAALGRSGVAKSLDESMMTPTQKQSRNAIREAALSTSDEVTEWFTKQNGTADGRQKMEDFDAIRGYDEDRRARFFDSHPEMQTSYAEYERYAAARSAINQFNETGKKKGASSGSRPRGGGGGGRRGGGGGGGAAPAAGGGGGGGATT